MFFFQQIVLEMFQKLLRDVERQQGHMEDVIDGHSDLKPKVTQTAEPGREEQLAAELQQLKQQTGDKVKHLQVGPNII